MNQSELHELQARVTFQEDTIEKLSQIVAEQQKSLDCLSTQVKNLSEWVLALAERSKTGDVIDEKPPHY